jgi:hypothetical protein
LRPFFLAASLSLLAAPAVAQAPAAEVSQALLDRFFAALPHQEEWSVKTDPDEGEVARLAALNPGRSAEVRAILAEHGRCFAPVARGATRRGLETIARRLGPAKLEALIALYGSEDFRRFDALGEVKAKGGALTPEQESAFGRFLADHPVAAEFAQAIGNVGPALAADEAFMSGLQGCAEARRVAFERAKLREE